MAGMQDLSTMFANGDFGLLDRGLQAQKTGQQTNEATLAALLQKQQQDAQMHPLDMQNKQALTANTNAQARNSNALAQTHEDQNKLFASIPMDKRVDAWMANELKNKSVAEIERLKSHMGAAGQIAASALSNGGRLPLSEQSRYAQSHPELLEYLKQPNGANILANMVTKFESMQADRLKSDSAHTISAAASLGAARIGADSRMEVAQLKAQQDQAKLQARMSQAGVDPIKQQAALIMQANEAEQAGDAAQAQLYRQWAQSLNNVAALAGRNLPQAGGVDLGAQTKDKVATVPAYDAVPGNKPVPPAKPQYSQEDLEFTAKKHGITVEQVKQKLGIK